MDLEFEFYTIMLLSTSNGTPFHRYNFLPSLFHLMMWGTNKHGLSDMEYNVKRNYL